MEIDLVMMKSIVVLSTAALIFTPLLASAQNYQREFAPGHDVRVQQRINQNSPGVTRDHATDAKQSATGGQSGGIPGQS